MKQLVFLQRYSSTSNCWVNLKRKQAISKFSVEELVSSYDGFDGEIIEIFPINGEDLENLAKIIDDLKFSKIDNSHMYLFISNINEKIPKFFENIFQFIGYEVGICDVQASVYSSIFNEILFGKINKLISFNKYLNKHFLFNDLTIAKEYLSVHQRLEDEGIDVESYSKMSIYSIWKYL